MPLTRATVTIASRVMVPTYPLFALYLGTIYATDPGGRLRDSPAFPFLPTPLWGAGFVVAGLLLVAAMAMRGRRLYAYALSPLMVWFVVWSVALAASAVFEGTSFSAPALPGFAAVACWATMLSLLAQES